MTQAAKTTFLENVVDDIEFLKNPKPNRILYIRNCKNSEIVTRSSLRFHMIIMENCENCQIQFLDSCTIRNRRCIIKNCTGITVLFDEIDVRSIECDNVKNSTINFADSPVTLENFIIYWNPANCSGNIIQRVSNIPDPQPKSYLVRINPKFRYQVITNASDPRLKEAVATVAAGGASVKAVLTWFDEDGTVYPKLITSKNEVVTLKTITGGSMDDEEEEESESTTKKPELVAIGEQISNATSTSSGATLTSVGENIAESAAALEVPEETSTASSLLESASNIQQAAATTVTIGSALTEIGESVQEKAESSTSFLRQISGFKKLLKPQSATTTGSVLATEEEEEEIEDMQFIPDGKARGVEDEEDSELTEFREDEETLKTHIKAIADTIKRGKHLMIYTGAGISTAAKIPDYRGPQGVWTKKDKGEKLSGFLSLDLVKPTYSHYAIAELVKRGICKYVVSTNCDGLHRRSGIPADKISELHGNSYREICEDCGKEFFRGFDVCSTVYNYLSHETGRLCTCGGNLLDTIVHFTEDVPEREMGPALAQIKHSDISLVLGTSCRVFPAASLPEKAKTKNNGYFFIVNLQMTPFDKECSLKVYAETDKFMQLLMDELGIDTFDTNYDYLETLTEEEREAY